MVIGFMHRKIVKILVIVCCVVLVLGVVYAVGRHFAMTAVLSSLQVYTRPLGWTVAADPAPVFWAPTCYKKIAFRGEADSHLTLHDVCLDAGLLSLMRDAPDIAVSTREIDGFLDWSVFLQLKNIHDQGLAPIGNGLKKHGGLIERILQARVTYDVEHTKINFGIPGIRVKFHSDDVAFAMDHGKARVSCSFLPSVDLARAPVAIASLPKLSLKMHVDLLTMQQVLRGKEKTDSAEDALGRKWASLEVTSEPTFDMSYVWKNETVHIKIAGVNAEISGKEDFSVGLMDVSLSLPENPVLGDAFVRRLNVAFSGKPSPDAFRAIRLVEPRLSLKLDGILASEKVLGDPILGSLARFWQKDAGAIFGDAPKLSVRREDVKKPRPKIRRNPIPRETLEKVKVAFNRLQQKIMALPAVDIQNGRIEMRHADGVFAFDAVSFNTSELFKDDQKFRFEFNMRDAKAAFEVSYADDSPFPALELSLSRLGASEFLSLLNMPVPDKSDGTVSADLHFAMDEAAFRFQGDIAFEHFAFFHEKISPNVIEDMNASMTLEVAYTFHDDKLSVSPLALTSGPVTASGFVNISQVRSDPVIEFELAAKDVPCASIPAAIPKGFLPTITDLQIAGTTFSPKLTGKIPWKNPLVSSLKETGFEGKCFPISVAPHQPSVLNDPKYTFTTDYTYFVENITVGPGTNTFTPLNRIPPYVRAAMLLTEDKRFFDHGPLRISFIERALRLNLNLRKYVYGGSTISQQLTKNLFLDRRKNLARKLEEAFIAWRMENVVAKSRILELYINMIEFGPDVYGITQAAKFYFDKKPENLTPLEGAYLASLKVSPSKGGRFYKSGFPTNGWWIKRMKYILKVLAENGYITPSEVLAAYPWIPQFVYPDPADARDPRNIWLKNYGAYLLEQARAKKREEMEAQNR